MIGGRGSGQWLRWYLSPPQRAWRLVCMPPAGSSASFYRSWIPFLPASVAFAGIQYPGRESRLQEPPLRDMHQLASGVAGAIGSDGADQLALFGHSMGAIVAYETARRLGSVSVLFVSACAPPASARSRIPKTWDDAGILADLQRLGGINHSFLQIPALLSLALPALRADYFLAENYAPTAGGILDCPVVAYCGSDDQEVSLEQMQQWSEVTSGSFHLIFFSGTHFFPLEKNNEVVAHILSVMKGKGKAPAPAYGPDELNRKL